ncbi:Yae1 family protein [uncultured Methanobrevibacter sp.]|uniref:Yae1 family protein n=1 Tax=uncultured Methanobrevibacter sp. TaxID=253161 RepID=UPI0025EAD51F|nr:Yae1 family protein [uncultured Methanobrevibacter sp.]
MSIETTKNRDIFVKFCFMYFLVHILKVLGIDEEIEEIMPTEKITFKKTGKQKIFENFLDFQALTKSGKILIFEVKKNPLTKKDLKQAYEYYDRVHCRQKSEVKLIIIALSKKGKITEYTKMDITYHPQIIKTKNINKQKDLSTIRNKLHHNEKLTTTESSLLIALPLFEIKESESEITEEICTYIKNKKHCIPQEIIDEITLAMYLNIIEYVEIDKQEGLLEMINMAQTYQGVIAQIKNEGFEDGKNKGFEDGKNEGFKDGKNKGERNIILRLLKNHTFEEVAKLLEIKETELSNILNKVD